jgi:hypothetical protein
MYIGLHVEYLLFLKDFNETGIFATHLRKNIEKSNFVKPRPVGAELFHADGQTDIHYEANSRFSKFCERAQKCLDKFSNHTSDHLV